jgi:hypothetical protein
VTTPAPGSDGADIDVSYDGAIIGAGLSALQYRTQENVQAARNESVKSDATLTSFSDLVFAGLPPGTPLPLAILIKAGQAITGLADFVWETVEDVVEAIGNTLFGIVKGLWDGAVELAAFAGDLLNDAGKVIGNIAEVVVDGVANFGQFLMSLWNAFTGQGATSNADTSFKTVQQVKDGAGSLAGFTKTAGDNAYTGIQNADKAQVSANDANNAAVANAAEITALQAAQKANTNSGVYGLDNFDYVNTSNLDPLRWDFVTNNQGYVRTDGVKAFWVDVGGADGTVVARLKDTPTNSSYQALTMVLASPILESPIFGGAECFNYIIGRMNASYTSYVYLKIGYNSLRLFKVVGGSDIPLGDAVSYTPKIGDTIQLVLGTVDSIYQFKVYVNNKSAFSRTDSTYYSTNPGVTTGPMSVESAATNNFGGLAWDSAPRFGGGQSTPGAVAIFSVADNYPAPVLGSGVRCYRSSTTPAALSTGNNIFPNGWFGQTSNKTPDLLYDSQTGKVTVSVEGWYHVVINQHGNAVPAVGAGGRIRSILWKNRPAGSTSTQSAFIDQEGFAQTYNSTTGFNGVTGTYIVYLRAGEWIEPGYNADSAISNVLIGDEDGSLTWFSVALINRSYA